MVEARKVGLYTVKIVEIEAGDLGRLHGWPSKSEISVADDGKTLIVFKPRDETEGFVF